MVSLLPRFLPLASGSTGSRSNSCVLERGGGTAAPPAAAAAAHLPSAVPAAAGASGDHEVSVMKPDSPRGEVSGKRSLLDSCTMPSATSACPSGSEVDETRSRTSWTLKRSLVVALKPPERRNLMVHRNCGVRVRSSSSVRAC